MKKVAGILFLIFLLFSLSWFSYDVSKSNAINLIGDTIEYFPLTKTGIAIEPIESKSIVWRFEFSPPNSSEDLYVYTNIFGNINRTIPRKLEYLLRCFEKQEYHPYSKEFIEISDARSLKGISAESICK